MMDVLNVPQAHFELRASDSATTAISEYVINGKKILYSLTRKMSDAQFLAGESLCDTDGFVIKSFSDTRAFQRECQKTSIAINKASADWHRHIFDPDSATDVDTMTETADAVFAVIEKFGPGAIDLTALQADHVNGEHLALVLRVTSQWRSKTPGWEMALHIASSALTRAGISPKDALVGLQA